MSLIELLEKFEEFIKMVPYEDINMNGMSTRSDTYFSDLRKKIEEVLKEQNGQKEYLAVPIISRFFKTMLPTIRVPLVDVMNGKTEKAINMVKELEEGIESFHYETYMAELTKKLSGIMDRCGFVYDKELLSEYEKCSDIVIEAIKQANKVIACGKQLSSGGYDKQSPAVYNQVISVNSEYEFYQNLKSMDNAVLLGCFRAKVKDGSDPIYEKLKGRPDEIVRNFARNHQKSIEEAKELYYRGGSKLLIGIKNGENIYIYDESNYDISEMETFYVYDGIRQSYMPYQLLYDDVTPPSDPKKNEVVLYHSGWMLKDVLDEEQALFFAMLFAEIYDKFFQSEAVCKFAGFYEDLKLLEENPQESTETLPAIGVPVKTLTKEFSIVEERLMKELNIDRHACMDTIVKPHGMYGSLENAAKTIERNADSLLAAEVKKRVSDEFFDEFNHLKSSKKKEIVDWLIAKTNVFSAEELLKRCKAFTWVIIHNEDILSLDMKHTMKDRYGNPKKGVTSSSDVCNVYSDKLMFTETASMHTRPSVLFRIRPRTAEDISVMTGVPYDELPLYLKIYDLFLNEKFLGFQIVSYSYTIKINVCSNKRDLKKLKKEIEEEA